VKIGTNLIGGFELKIDESPALTRVMPIDASPKEKIDFLKEQVSELKQQIKCYNRMIGLRNKAIKSLGVQDAMINLSKRKLMAGLIGPHLKSPLSRPRKKVPKRRKTKRKSK